MKKWFLTVNIFGWVQTIIGALGTFGFILYACTFIYFILLSPQDTKAGEGAVWSLGFMIFLLPTISLLWAGIGVLKRKPAARRINLIIAAILLIFTLFMCSISKRITYGIPFIVFFSMIILFLNLPAVKKQFK